MKKIIKPTNQQTKKKYRVKQQKRGKPISIKLKLKKLSFNIFFIFRVDRLT